MITSKDVEAVLIALGENFIVDVPAKHDGKGDYQLDYFELVTFLVNPAPAWVQQIQGYINTKG